MEERGASVLPLSEEEEELVDVPPSERRALLDPILEESFKGLYLWHARRTLREVERVRAASIGGEVVGLAMLTNVSSEAGYVYYIAVAPEHRRRGVGRRLLGDALEYFEGRGSEEVYASIEEQNVESMALFASAGFRKTDHDELSRKYGAFRALDMYRKMLVVPGEELFFKELRKAPAAHDQEQFP
jgi:ribosomal protein S18 acetylase RimI-like enzyme